MSHVEKKLVSKLFSKTWRIVKGMITDVSTVSGQLTYLSNYQMEIIYKVIYEKLTVVVLTNIQRRLVS